MADSKELYKLLSSDFKAENRFYFVSRGEGMMQGREKDSGRVFLINTNTQEAWELLKSDGHFSLWDKSSVEIAATFALPDEARRNAVELRSPFYFGINEYKNGVASVSWTLQPDGRYYADEDGFGMEDDEEIDFTSFIDQSANILIPFQQMDDAIQVRYSKQAAGISKNREEVPYVCLTPEMTIPLSDNRRLGDHKDKLIKIIYGMMIRFGSKVENANKHDEYAEFLGIVTSINPNPEHYLSISLIGKKSESNNEKYELSTVAVLFKKGQEPQGIGVMMGEYPQNEIADAMLIEDNAETIYNEFIQLVKELYA